MYIAVMIGPCYTFYMIPQDHYIKGFIKAALAAPMGGASIPKPQTTPTASMRPPAAMPQAKPMSAPQQPMNQHPNWQLRGGASTGGHNTSVYFDPSDTNKSTAWHHLVDGQEAGPTGNIGMTQKMQTPVDPTTEISSLRRALMNPEHSVWNDPAYGMPSQTISALNSGAPINKSQYTGSFNQPSPMAKSMAGEMQQDAFANQGIPRLNPKIRGQAIEQSPEQEMMNFQHNKAIDPSIMNLLSRLNPELAAEASSPDPGIREQFQRTIHNMSNSNENVDPRSTSDFYQRLFGRHN